MRNSYIILAAIITALLETSASAQQAQGCSFDTQCKGDRICENGMCISPSSRGSTPVNNGAQPPQNQTMDAEREYVGINLGWCMGDWGHNEGAQEAINYINTAVSAGYASQVGAVVGIINNLPGGLGAGIAGETLKRPPIMDAAKALVQVSPDLAVQLALTCQAHNGAGRNRLSSRPDLVAAFLKGEIPNLWR
ncbi:hypothetical protein [Rhizobium leguminosarum]|uniref:Uncharacterized protein n=1 Tax=Rhizobium leguminosarum TaxID=384 RepID=A0A7W9ZW16_RHILE|nr:hypothetical protein [Rhizobium leguminosarum]MBB6223847.1 hypothetical protein [Rhizobium leguminosarum]